jgi:hypothetical protein
VSDNVGHVINRTLYREENRGRWCHGRKTCIVAARLKGVNVTKWPLRSFYWFNDHVCCVGCEQFINYKLKEGDL